MLRIYSSIMGASTFFLRSLLNKRCRKGKEDPERLEERMGLPGRARPEGRLAWVHAASVGESQSTLILIDALLRDYPDLNILVTTGTVTSAALMEKRLPRQAFHQYYPLDHPKWVARFLGHWHPDMAIWMESEIWPNMLRGIKERDIPAAIVNARLSPESFKRWKMLSKNIETLLETFSVCLAQTEEDAALFRKLGMRKVITTDNLKFSAAPLPFDQGDLDNLKRAIADRHIWLFASTHEAEEEMACRIHSHIRKAVPDLLTIIVPRHTRRGKDIIRDCEKYGLNITLRDERKALPGENDQVYIANTMGELGLFYRLSPIACIGRSFSNDGGGGHNPIEAAQLNCAVLHGPRVQNLQRIYDEFKAAGASLPLKSEQDFQNRLERLLLDHDGLEALQNKAGRFVDDKAKVLEKILKELKPVMSKLTQDDKATQCA